MIRTITFFFLIISLQAFPQASSGTEYVLDSIPYGNSAYIRPTPDSGFVVMMRLGGSSVAYGTLIVKFDREGVKTWSRYISTIVTSYCDVLPMNNGYFVTGYTGDDHIQLIRLDGNGNMLWRKLYIYGSGSTSGTGGAQFGFSLHKLSESTLMIYGVYEGRSDGLPTVVCTKVRTDGSLVWTKQYNQTGTYGRAISLPDHSIIWNNTMSVTNLDTLGNVKWNRTTNVSTYATKAVGLQGGTAFCSFLPDSNFVYKLDDNGNLLWTSNKMRITPYNMIENGTDLLVCGISTFYGDKYITLATLDEHGALKKQVFFNKDTAFVSARVIKTLNNKFAILAVYPNRFRILSFDDPSFPFCDYNEVALSRVQGAVTFGTEAVSPAHITFYAGSYAAVSTIPMFIAQFPVCSAVAGIDNSSENDLTAKAKVYPNPANADIRVELLRELSGTFILYDMLGKPVFTQEFSGKELEISVPGIAKGMYYYELKNNSELFAKGKLLFQ